MIEKEDKEPDQARAQCEGMWNQHQKNKNKKKSEAGSIIQSIMSEKAWIMEPEALQQFIVRVHGIDFKEESFSQELMCFFDDDSDDDMSESKPYKMENGVAIVDIHGPLIKKASGFLAFLLGITGMVQIGKIFSKAIADSEVKGIFLDIDSPGGMVDGTSDLADLIFESREKKPVLAFADGAMASAAQWIGSSAGFVAAANEVTQFGSLGITSIHLDFADEAKNLGVKPTVFSTGKYKAIGNKFEHLTKEGKAYIQSHHDYLHGLFVQAISKNTGIPESKLDKDLKESKIFMGSQGVAVGLAHAVMNRKQAMGLLSDVADGKTTFEKHKVEMKSINYQGGENNMDEKELKAKNEELETQLKAAQDLISEMNTSTEVKELKSQIVDLTTEKTGFELKLSEVTAENDTLKADAEAGVETLREEIETLKAGAKSNEIFVSAGKTHIDNLKAEIKTTSVQVDGNAYNETLVDKQLMAFGNDVELLSQFKTSLDTRLAAMVKTGDLIPDKSDKALTDDEKKAKTEQAEYTLGSKIVPMRMRIKE